MKYRRQLIILIIGATLEGSLFMGIIIAGFIECISPPVVYETNDLGDYGNLMVYSDDSKANQMFSELFPGELLPSFQDVKYHYKALYKYGNGWAYEIYLEFTIDDEQTFMNYVDSVAPIDQFAVFPYDRNYLEYSLKEPEFFLGTPITDGDYLISGEFLIDSADIEAVFIEPVEHRMIIWGLSVRWDGIVCDTSDFLFFFNRFHIDPIEYSENLEATIRLKEIREESRKREEEMIPDWVGSFVEMVAQMGDTIDDFLKNTFTSIIGLR